MTQFYERKLGQRNFHKLSHPGTNVQQPSSVAVLESACRSLEPDQTDRRLVSVAR